MLKDVLNKELNTLKLDASELIELEEEMAGGCGCRGEACAGACTVKKPLGA